MSKQTECVALLVRASPQVGGLEKVVVASLRAETKTRLILGTYGPVTRPRRNIDAIVNETGVAALSPGWLAVLRADALHVHAPTTTFWPTRYILLARLLGKGCWVTVHLPAEPVSTGRLSYRVRVLLRLAWCRLVIALARPVLLCPSTVSAKEAAGRLSASVGVFYNAVPESECVDSESDRPELRLLFLGRLEEVKRPAMFVQSIYEAQRSGALVTATIAGTGSQADEIQARLQELQAQMPDLNIDLAGHVHDTDPLLCAHDALVMTSTAEGLPMAVLEAAMAGCLIVAPRSCESVAEAVGPDWIRVEDDSAEGFAAAYDWVMEHRKASREMAQRAKTSVQGKFAMSAFAHRLDKLYGRA
jgi:glycosyltransferase involved in cell wall biosynthesis